jgi:hypothetical protein
MRLQRHAVAGAVRASIWREGFALMLWISIAAVTDAIASALFDAGHVSSSQAVRRLMIGVSVGTFVWVVESPPPLLPPPVVTCNKTSRRSVPTLCYQPQQHAPMPLTETQTGAIQVQRIEYCNCIRFKMSIINICADDRIRIFTYMNM